MACTSWNWQSSCRTRERSASARTDSHRRSKIITEHPSGSLLPQDSCNATLSPHSPNSLRTPVPNGRYKVHTTSSLGFRSIQSRSFGFSHVVFRTWTASSTVLGFFAVAVARQTMIIAAKVTVFIKVVVEDILHTDQVATNGIGESLLRRCPM